MKDETGGAALVEFVVLKPKIYSFLVDNNEHKKAEDVNKNVVTIVNHNKHEYVFLNKKCIRHSMNKIQTKDHRIGTYNINKIFFALFLMTKYIFKTMVMMD